MSCIQLISIKYSERSGTPNEWVLDQVPLSKVNLIVGKNATGKTRTLNIIAGLARLLTATPRFMVADGSYDVLFDNDGVKLRYTINIEDSKVKVEKYFIADKNVLSRNHSGISEIEMHSPDSTPKMVQFSPPEDELAVVVRRDAIQHPYLERLHEWAQATRHYTFGTSLGRESFAVIVKDAPDVDDRDTNQVVGIFRKAQREYPDSFIESIKQDMAKMRYEINDVEITVPKNIKILNSIAELTCIGIKEEGLDRIIEQTEMSQGMFRALSILIQVNYSQMANRASCILIDDIGEGLDFERLTQLIDILRQKAEDSSFQLIMTTNDRFVMNSVPLREWLVLQRQGGNVRVRNYDNSKELFDDFKFTGLSNFSFLEMDFLNNNETTGTDA